MTIQEAIKARTAEKPYIAREKWRKENQEVTMYKRLIVSMLDKITSPELLQRVYRFVQYIYIHVQP